MVTPHPAILGRRPGGRLRQLAAVSLVAALLAVPSIAAAQETSSDSSDSTEGDHLRRGLEYFEAGDYASAKIEFEAVLRRDDLPPSLHQQAELYAEAARQYLAGSRLQASGYVVLGFGNYAENDTVAGNAEINDMFFSARAGGQVNYLLSTANTLNLSLDYRYRNYDDDARRNDSDLRWNANVSHVAGDANVALGVRGRASYRGNGQTRNDYGVFTQIRFVADPDDQFSFGAEIRRRAYPQGPLRQRSRNIVEFTGGWTRALFDGKASFSLAAGGGLEKSTDDRPDGDSAFVNLSPNLSFTLNERWSGYVFGWWQNDAYNVERINSDIGDSAASIGRRNDNLWEVGGGLSWEFGSGWSLNPEILWTRDESNVVAANYSATELHLTVRKDF